MPWYRLLHWASLRNWPLPERASMSRSGSFPLFAFVLFHLVKESIRIRLHLRRCRLGRCLRLVCAPNQRKCSYYPSAHDQVPYTCRHRVLHPVELTTDHTCPPQSLTHLTAGEIERLLLLLSYRARFLTHGGRPTMLGQVHCRPCRKEPCPCTIASQKI